MAMTIDEALEAVGRIHNRVNEIAKLEARSALVNGWAAQGHLMPEKERLIQQAEDILDQLLPPSLPKNNTPVA